MTASHVIKDLRRHQREYADAALWVENGERNIVKLVGDHCATKTATDHTSTKHPLSGDDLDIAVWKLGKTTIKALTEKSYLTSMDICSDGTDYSSGVYYLAGWPCEWCKVDSAQKRIDFKCMMAIAHSHPEPDKVPDFNPRLHMAVQMSKTTETPAVFKGISGCSIWKLSDLPLRKGWKPEHARLAAIQTGVCMERGIDAVKGTRWEHVARLLEHSDSRLSQAIRGIIRPKETI